MSQKPFVSKWVEVGPGVQKPGPSSVGEKRGADECDGPELKIPRRVIPKIVPYGTFYIIGRNGFIPPCNRGRVRSYCHLKQRDYGNGLKVTRAYNAANPNAVKGAMALRMALRMYSVVYKFSVGDSVIVEYEKDTSKDLFQIGRSAEPPIDFVVMDVDYEPNKQTSSVSRFACRVQVDRQNPKDIRAYAGGFDESLNMFLGEKAIKWHDGSSLDALTTNGILISHPQGDFWGGDAKPGNWRELSVCGKLYTLRPSDRDSKRRGAQVSGETNALKDGSLIDVCGATLLWRSAEALQNSVSKKELNESLFKSIVECQQSEEESDASKFPIPQVSRRVEKTRVPHVHFNCGHLQSNWNPKSIPEYARCPVCLQYGPTAELCVGIEPAFYVDKGPLLYAFNPCGHIANKKTVMYWSSYKLPTRYTFEPQCPFCATALEEPGYVRLRPVNCH